MSGQEQVLVGDVGGTKVRLALASQIEGKVSLDEVIVYTDPAIPSFDDAIDLFIKETGVSPKRALFALAGPLDDNGSIRLTNRSWPRVNPAYIATRFSMQHAMIVNDFAAMARAIPELTTDQFETIIESSAPPDAPVLVTGPGTGFGVSTLIRSGTKGWQVITGEGGHVAFAPRNDREVAIRNVIARTHGYVSVEMIVSGGWLMPVYHAICELDGVNPHDLSPQEMLDLADKDDAVCHEVCAFRANTIMGAIGDGALITGARGGIVLTGGVAERMTKWLRSPAAIERFHERGPMTPYLAHTPVSVLMNGMAPLIGAAALAFEETG